jgi:hypothetical protein
MRMHRALVAGIGMWVACLLLIGAYLALPANGADGAGMQTPSATTDPGRGTPNNDPGPASSPTTTRPAGTPTAGPGTPTRPPATPTRTPTPTPRAGNLTVTPASAAVGVEITIAGAGFSANAPLALIVEDAQGATAHYSQPAVDGSGNFTVRLNTNTWQPGQYAVTVASLPDVNALARASFTLTGAPGLPNTGEGAENGRGGQFVWLFAVAGFLVLLGLGGAALRRRSA